MHEKTQYESADETPNAETVAALNEASGMRAHPEQYKRYASFDEFLSEVISGF